MARGEGGLIPVLSGVGGGLATSLDHCDWLHYQAGSHYDVFVPQQLLAGVQKCLE